MCTVRLPRGETAVRPGRQVTLLGEPSQTTQRRLVSLTRHRAPDELGRLGTPSFYAVQDRRYGWSWRCLSTICARHDGPMRHSFRLFQELNGLNVAGALVVAVLRSPEAEA